LGEAALAVVHVASPVLIVGISFLKAVGTCAAADDVVGAAEALSARFFPVVCFWAVRAVRKAVLRPAVLGVAARAGASRIIVRAAVASFAQRICVTHFALKRRGAAFFNGASPVAEPSVDSLGICWAAKGSIARANFCARRTVASHVVVVAVLARCALDEAPTGHATFTICIEWVVITLGALCCDCNSKEQSERAETNRA
jgi:hypothetical protein